MSDKKPRRNDHAGEHEHDWMLFTNGFIAIRKCRRCNLVEDAS